MTFHNWPTSRRTLYYWAVAAATCDIAKWQTAFTARYGFSPDRRLYEAKRKDFEFARLVSAGLSPREE